MPATKISVPLWLLACWFAPPVVAEALGWRSLWGGDRVFADYAMPLPMASGILHLMTMTVVGFGLFLGLNLRSPWRELTPAFVLATAELGCVFLFDMGTLYLHQTTDLAGSAWRVEQNPLGLFLVSDALFCLLWLPGRADLWPRTWLTRGAALVLAAMPALALSGALLSSDRRATGSFVRGASIHPGARGDEGQAMFTRLDVNDPAFRPAAEKEAVDYDPRTSEVFDQAVYFMTSLQAATTARDGTGAAATYCMYDDGAPAVWHAGYGDCFSQHETFEDRIQTAVDRLTVERVPREVAGYLAVIEACTKEPVATVRNPRCAGDLTQPARLLLTNYGSDPKVRAMIEATIAK